MRKTMRSRLRLRLVLAGVVCVLAAIGCTTATPAPPPAGSTPAGSGSSGPVVGRVAPETSLTAGPPVAPTMPAAMQASPAPSLTVAPELSPTPPPSPTPTATSTPDPVAGYTIADLRARSYGGGNIEIVRTIDSNAAYTRYLMAYLSDGLRITGVLAVPKGRVPAGGFPVIVLNHGYISPSVYKTGTRYVAYVDYFARHGYLVLNPDYRGHDGSDKGPNIFRTGYAIDVLNLLADIKTLPQAKPDGVGMLGHSMGGNVTQRVLVVTDTVKAAVLYASTSGREGERWRPLEAGQGGTPEPTHTARPGERGFGDFFGGLSIPAASRTEAYRRLSPATYYGDITAAISIHHGAADATVRPDLSVRLRDDLQAAGKDVEYFSYPGQPHSFVGSGLTLFLQRTVAFFDRHVKN